MSHQMNVHQDFDVHSILSQLKFAIMLRTPVSSHSRLHPAFLFDAPSITIVSRHIRQMNDSRSNPAPTCTMYPCYFSAPNGNHARQWALCTERQTTCRKATMRQWALCYLFSFRAERQPRTLMSTMCQKANHAPKRQPRANGHYVICSCIFLVSQVSPDFVMHITPIAFNFFKRDPCNDSWLLSVPFVRDSIRSVLGRPKPSLAGPMNYNVPS